MSPPQTLAIVGLIAGAGTGILLYILAATRTSPTGDDGEKIMWLYTYAALLGFPTSILANAIQVRIESGTLRDLAVLSAIPINWGALGFVLGWLIRLFVRMAA